MKLLFLKINLSPYHTWHGIIEWIEEGHNHIDDHNAIEEYAAPQWHVAANPEEQRLTWGNTMHVTQHFPAFMLKFHTYFAVSSAISFR